MEKRKESILLHENNYTIGRFVIIKTRGNSYIITDKGGEIMFLRIIINDLTANDADHFLREITSRGADGKIVFGGAFAQSVVATQKGSLEDLLGTASVAFHADSFRVEISG